MSDDNILHGIPYDPRDDAKRDYVWPFVMRALIGLETADNTAYYQALADAEEAGIPLTTLTAVLGQQLALYLTVVNPNWVAETQIGLAKDALND
jgi:hypothetical protein